METCNGSPHFNKASNFPKPNFRFRDPYKIISEITLITYPTTNLPTPSTSGICTCLKWAVITVQQLLAAAPALVHSVENTGAEVWGWAPYTALWKYFFLMKSSGAISHHLKPMEQHDPILPLSSSMNLRITWQWWRWKYWMLPSLLSLVNLRKVIEHFFDTLVLPYK